MQKLSLEKLKQELHRAEKKDLSLQQKQITAHQAQIQIQQQVIQIQNQQQLQQLQSQLHIQQLQNQSLQNIPNQ